EGGGGGGEVGAGVDHPFVEPEAVEVVAEVVVGAGGGARAGRGGGAGGGPPARPPSPPAPPPAPPRRAGGRPRGPPPGARPAAPLDAAVAVGVAEAWVGAEQELQQGRAVAEADAGDGRVGRGGDLVAVPEDGAHGRVAEHAQALADQPAVQGRGSAGGARRGG